MRGRIRPLRLLGPAYVLIFIENFTYLIRIKTVVWLICVHTKRVDFRYLDLDLTGRRNRTTDDHPAVGNRNAHSSKYPKTLTRIHTEPSELLVINTADIDAVNYLVFHLKHERRASPIFISTWTLLRWLTERRIVVLTMLMVDFSSSLLFWSKSWYLHLPVEVSHALFGAQAQKLGNISF